MNHSLKTVQPHQRISGSCFYPRSFVWRDRVTGLKNNKILVYFQLLLKSRETVVKIEVGDIEKRTVPLKRPALSEKRISEFLCGISKLESGEPIALIQRTSPGKRSRRYNFCLLAAPECRLFLHRVCSVTFESINMKKEQVKMRRVVFDWRCIADRL